MKNVTSFFKTGQGRRGFHKNIKIITIRCKNYYIYQKEIFFFLIFLSFKVQWHNKCVESSKYEIQSNIIFLIVSYVEVEDYVLVLQH